MRDQYIDDSRPAADGLCEADVHVQTKVHHPRSIPQPDKVVGVPLKILR